MKEIKFRAWDEKTNEMYHSRPSHTVWGGGLCGRVVSDTGSIEIPLTQMMQFTGLKDKNGKEIYEGDVIDAWVSRWPDRKPLGVVIWNEHCAAFQLQYEGAFGNNPSDFIHQWHFFEIKGNIYENPELLKP